jgi:hypothetical protein
VTGREPEFPNSGSRRNVREFGGLIRTVSAADNLCEDKDRTGTVDDIR